MRAELSIGGFFDVLGRVLVFSFIFLSSGGEFPVDF